MDFAPTPHARVYEHCFNIDCIDWEILLAPAGDVEMNVKETKMHSGGNYTRDPVRYVKYSNMERKRSKKVENKLLTMTSGTV